MDFIKEITTKEVFSVRHPVLRKAKPIESCAFEGDNNASTKHFGYFINSNLVGVASIYVKNIDCFTTKNQFQLRGMAVLESYQNLGIGQKLLKYIESEIENREQNILWFNAREVAVGFYEKLGYEIFGNSFEIPNIGKHFVMYKAFNEKL